jgi:tyrosyl-tRNA synthetase
MSSPLWELVRARAARIEVEDHLGERLLRGDKLRVKLGLDPTAPDIHVGHLVVLDVMRASRTRVTPRSSSSATTPP